MWYFLCNFWGVLICCYGCEDAVCSVAVCSGGGCGASVLAGGGNDLVTNGTTGSTGGDGSGLVGTTTGEMNFLFLVYLAPEGFSLWMSQRLLLSARLVVQVLVAFRKLGIVGGLGVAVLYSCSTLSVAFFVGV